MLFGAMAPNLKQAALISVAAVGFSVAAVVGLQANAPRPLIVLAGQSNAVGPTADAAKLSSLPQGKLWWSDGVTNTNSWNEIGPQPGGFEAGHFGPEIGIAGDIDNASIFKFAAGATSLAKDWTPDNSGGLLSSMLESLQAAMAEDPKLSPYCFVFVQGESDAETDEFSASYDHRLRTLIAKVRGLLDPQIPIVLSVDELHPWVVSRPQVVAVQKAIAGADPFIEFVSFSDLEKADTTHLVAEATIEQGKRYAEACKRLHDSR